MVDKVITSPPYNIRRDLPDVRYDVHKDGIPNEEYSAWVIRVFGAIDKVLRKDGCVLWNMSYGNENPEAMILTMADVMRKTDFTMADVIVWRKGSAWPNNVSSNKVTRRCEFVFVMCRRPEYDTFTTNKKVVGSMPSGQAVYENVFNFFDAPSGDATELNHSAFSVQFANELIRRYVRDGDVVLDPFGGTGTTMLACDQKGIKGYYSELSEAQCAYAVKRLSGLGKGGADNAVGLL